MMPRRIDARVHSMRGVRLAAAILCGVLAAPAIGAQVCVGGIEGSSLSLAVAYGRASGAATLTGADFAWQLTRSIALIGDGGVTAYPTPDPSRKRLALGLAYTAYRSGRVAICLTPGIEWERIGELRVLRVPLGVSLGWATTFANGRGRIGLYVAPSAVYTAESVEMFSDRRGYLSGRAGVVLGYGPLMLGLEQEHAFDNDARWNTRARLGFVLRRRAREPAVPGQGSL